MQRMDAPAGRLVGCLIAVAASAPLVAWGGCPRQVWEDTDFDHREAVIEGISLDGQGCVYTAASTWSSGSMDDWVIRKLSPDGKLEWTRTSSRDSQGGAAQEEAPASKEQGDPYGFDTALTTRMRAARAAGRLREKSLPDRARKIAATSDGTSYVAGAVRGQLDAWIVRKYATAGNAKWSVQIQVPGDHKCLTWPMGIAIAEDGGVVVAGDTCSTGAEGDDWFVCRISPQGKMVWHMVHRLAKGFTDHLSEIGSDRQGNIYVAGSGDAITTSHGWTWGLVKLSPKGEVIWTVTGAGASFDSGRYDLAVSPNGDFAVSGELQRDQEMLAMYSGQGRPLWAVKAASGDLALGDEGQIILAERGGQKTLSAYSGQGQLVWRSDVPTTRVLAAGGGRIIGGDGPQVLAYATDGPCPQTVVLDTRPPALEEDTSAPTLAVAELEPLGVSKSDAAVISDMLRNAIVAEHSFRVVEKAQMDKVIVEQQFQQYGCTSEECVVRLGKILNVRYLVVGSFGKALEQYILTVRIVNVESGQVLQSNSVQGKDLAGVQEGMNQIAKRLASLTRKR